MGLLSWIVRGILFLFVFRLAAIVFRAFFGGFMKGSQPRPGTRPAERGAAPGRIEELVQDPVCGMHVARSSAIAGRYQGEPAWFCSKECAEKANP